MSRPAFASARCRRSDALRRRYAARQITPFVACLFAADTTAFCRSRQSAPPLRSFTRVVRRASTDAMPPIARHATLLCLSLSSDSSAHCLPEI